MLSEKTANVHRFNSQVAFSTENMPNTVYLTEDMARKLALELLKAADDIKNCPKYHLSQCTSVNLKD